MIAFENVQSTAKALIAAAEFFSGKTVLEDLGTIDDQRETALRTSGFCVTILPLFRGNITGQTQSIAIVSCIILVLVEINAEINAGDGGAGINIYEAVKAVKQALLQRVPTTHPQDNFRLSSEPFEFSDHDPGLLSYVLSFEKLAVF